MTITATRATSAQPPRNLAKMVAHLAAPNRKRNRATCPLESVGRRLRPSRAASCSARATTPLQGFAALAAIERNCHDR
jgi:hypothetical protein